MNNKPVAWMELYYGEPNNLSWTDAELRDSGEVYKTVPLYTHPVKEDEGKVCARCGAIAYDPVITQTVKELTDEEIYELADQCRKLANPNVEFARAILRKAQEK